MRDAEKLALIGKMIQEFFEYNDEKTIAAGGEVFLCAISTVIEFQGDQDDGSA